MRYGSAFVKETNRRVRDAGLQPCPTCRGKAGKEGTEKCPTCKGAGTVSFNFMDLWEVEVSNPDGSPGGLNEISVEDGCRALDEGSTFGGMPYERKLAVAKLSVLGKRVTLFYDGVQVGAGFILNKMEQSFDLFPELHDNHPALVKLLDICTAALLGKSVPPQRSAQTPAAPTTGPGASSRRSGA